MRFLHFILFAAVVSGLAHANQISLICSSIGPGNSRQATIVCPQFDDNGILKLVTITLSGSLDGSVTLNNTDSNTSSGQATVTTAFSFGPLLGFAVPSPEVVVAASTGTQSVGAKGSQTSQVNGSNSVSDTNNSNLASYQGSGTFSVPVNTQTTSTISGGGDLGGTVTTQTTASADVVYTFLPTDTSSPLLSSAVSNDAPGSGAAGAVPEPGTWLLTGFMLAAAYLLTKFRRSA